MAALGVNSLVKGLHLEIDLHLEEEGMADQDLEEEVLSCLHQENPDRNLAMSKDQSFKTSEMNSRDGRLLVKGKKGSQEECTVLDPLVAMLGMVHHQGLQMKAVM